MQFWGRSLLWLDSSSTFMNILLEHLMFLYYLLVRVKICPKFRLASLTVCQVLYFEILSDGKKNMGGVYY